MDRTKNVPAESLNDGARAATGSTIDMIVALARGVTANGQDAREWLSGKIGLSCVLGVATHNLLEARMTDPVALPLSIHHAIEILPRTPGVENDIDTRASIDLANAIRRRLAPRVLMAIDRSVASLVGGQAASPALRSDQQPQREG